MMESALLANRAGVPGFCRRALGRGVLVPWPALGPSAVLSSSAQITLKDAWPEPSTSSMAQGEGPLGEAAELAAEDPQRGDPVRGQHVGPEPGPARIGPSEVSP